MGRCVGARTGTLKNPTKCLWRWEPDRRSNFFSLPAHLCAVTYMTEISLIVMLNNQFAYLQGTHTELILKCNIKNNPDNSIDYKNLETLEQP